MNKKAMSYLALAIGFGLMNVIVFAVPTLKTVTFWIAYGFSVVAFGLQIGIWQFAFSHSGSLKSKALGIPVVHVGLIYLAAQLVALVVFTALPLIDSWVALVACAVLLALTGISIVGTEFGKQEINRIDNQIQGKVFFIKSLQVDAELLVQQETDPETKTALEKLAEQIRYSDPMSHQALAGLENQIADKLSALKTAEDKATLINELDSLLTERNKKAKLLK